MAINQATRNGGSCTCLGGSIKAEDNISNEYRPMNAKDDESTNEVPRNLSNRIR